MGHSGRGGDDPFEFLEHAEGRVVRLEPTREEPARHFHALMPESVVDGTWRLKTVIGRGGFGVVFEAEHIDDDRDPVALKVVAPEDDGAWGRRFVQEAEVAMRIEHPHVVDTRGHGRLFDGSRYLVMELLEGETLAERLMPRRGLPWPRVAALLEQLGDALGAVHAEGIVHRDVKPGNVMLADTEDHSTRAVLIDFGLCKGPAALTASRELVGTVSHLAPEVLRDGASAVDERADVYGLALVAYEAVTGQPAFDAPTMAEVAAEVLRGVRPGAVSRHRPDAPDELARSIEEGLALRPSGRPADVADYGRRLAGCVRVEDSAS